jgi:AcrR family transcriptional regulator
MFPRIYRVGQRAEAAAEIHRRLVVATLALHTERGTAATSLKQIAQRAGISIGAAYLHFPAYEDAILARGQRAAASVPPPCIGIFEWPTSVSEGLRRLAREVFAYHDWMPALERIRCDQHLLPVLRCFVEAVEQQRATLVCEALQPARNRGAAGPPCCRAPRYWRVALQRAGFPAGEAAEEIASLILAPPGSRSHRRG